ncbi:hypothetical protein [Actinoplanes sp. NPDC049599]|uniref:hypothetical protein n=1 Tax=Actinoplanes sp. NPDC049599 TaxID=3363903 RepID=UPI0037A78E59
MIVGGDRSVVTVPVKPCCLVLLGDVCDCPPGTVAADPEPSSSYPTPQIFISVGGRLVLHQVSHG